MERRTQSNHSGKEAGYAKANFVLAGQQPGQTQLVVDVEDEGKDAHPSAGNQEPLRFSFSEPAALTGVTSREKVVLKVKNASFKYSGASKNSVSDVSLGLSQATRAVLRGPSGSGKSALAKLLVGLELPTDGDVLRASGLRVGYFPQQPLRLLEKHLERSPTDYLGWRFSGHGDRELFESAELTLQEATARAAKWLVDGIPRPCQSTAEELLAVTPEEVIGRREKQDLKILEYHVRWSRCMLQPKEAQTWVPRDILVKMGYARLVKQEDERQAAGAEAEELDRDLLKRHLAGFGLDEISSSVAIRKLSGRQKLALIFAAVTLKHPHILILDDATKLLDLPSKDALSAALGSYRGGILAISNDEGFIAGLAAETWHMSNGNLLTRVPTQVPTPKLAEKQNSLTMSFKDKHLIQALERKIKENKINPLPDEEVFEIFDQLTELKEVLLNDIVLQDPEDEDAEPYALSGLEVLVEEQLSEILMDEFGADLKNFRRTQKEYNLKLSLLIERSESELDLVGFVAYKTWGPPKPAVSIGAVGVSSKHRGKGYGRQLMKVAEDRAALLGCETPEGFVAGEVRLRSLATAVQFYERLGYERVDEGPDSPPPEKTPGCPDPESTTRDPEEEIPEEDAPCVPMVKRFAPFSPRSKVKMGPMMSPRQQPWSPKQARALEDGPTWPRLADLMLPEASA
mmetsp:Transcript_96148/g.170643  ORF Transcript_96148/g.170643 Transcript_96148/m.170643 type:complete len:686 (+) Transcript_96148:48-2105(+)